MRYKGQHTRRHVEREHPYWVDIQIPDGGLGMRLDQMYDWHTARGLPVRRGSGMDRARFCFPDKANAEAFAAAFDGTLTLNLSPKHVRL